MLYLGTGQEASDYLEEQIKKGMSVKDAWEQTYTWGIDGGTAYRIAQYLAMSSVKTRFKRFAKKELSSFQL